MIDNRPSTYFGKELLEADTNGTNDKKEKFIIKSRVSV